jgi:hypothetical protein
VHPPPWRIHAWHTGHAGQRFFDREVDERPRPRLAGFFGTFAPARRASESPIAIACLRLVTFLPLPPLRSVPCFLSCMVFSTFLDAVLCFAMMSSFLAAVQQISGQRDVIVRT